jgi:hypothetical protein
MRLVLVYRLEPTETVADAVPRLGLLTGVPVLVVVGGAGGVDSATAGPIDDIVRNVLLPVVQETDAVVIDGATDSGVMRGLGRGRAETDWPGPLVGVAVEALVGGDDGSALEPHHTHVLLTEGHEWGDESAVLADLAGAVAAGRPSVTVLLNGGPISRHDVRHSLARNRPVLAFSSTGRLAAELAAEPPAGVISVPGDATPDAQRELLRGLLRTGPGGQGAGWRRTS